jgi:ubiquinone/menaquinone biosynthesis C-methylase UbiE
MAEIPANLNRFSSVAKTYHSHRPKPPEGLRDFLLDYWWHAYLGHTADHSPKPNENDKPLPIVMDLGAGTGLSTVLWKDYCSKLIAVEPNKDMREVLSSLELNIEIIEEPAHRTKQKDNSVDIITSSQSFHWMNPMQTIPHICRILKPGGLFAAYDCDWPVLVTPELEDAYEDFFIGLMTIHTEQPRLDRSMYFPKEDHYQNLQMHGSFQQVNEAVFQNREICTLERYLGIAYSQGNYATLKMQGYSAEELGQDKFEEKVGAIFKNHESMPMWVNYRIRFGIMPFET